MMKPFVRILCSFLLLCACATRNDVRQVQTKMEVLEKEASKTDVTVVRNLEDVRDNQKRLNARVDDAQSKTAGRIDDLQNSFNTSMTAMLRNQADVRADLDGQRTLMNSVAGNIDENSHFLKSVDDRLKSLEVKIREIHGLNMDASMATIQKMETMRAAIETGIAALREDLDSLKKSLPEKNAEKKTEGGKASTIQPEPAQKPASPMEGDQPSLAAPPAEKAPEKKQKSSAKKGLAADDLYHNAYRDFLKGDFAQSQSGFSEFVKRFPKADQATDAQFWLAQSLANTGKLKEAAEAFGLVAKNFPKSPKAPTSMLRMAELQGKLGNKEEVRAILTKICDDYPSSVEATLAGEKLKVLDEHRN